MFYSKRLKLLFIACPKTGSTSVAEHLLSLDPAGERFRITLENGIVDSSSVKSESLGHATAAEFRAALGASHYDSLQTFGFVRDPIEKLVSAYFFTRGRSVASAFKMRKKQARGRLVTKRIAARVAAKLLPFSVWAAIFPMKKCSSYFLDDSGRIVVDFLGATHRLNEDLNSILADAGIEAEKESVPHINQSVHDRTKDYLVRDGFLYRYLCRRYATDLELFLLVKDAYVDCRELDQKF